MGLFDWLKRHDVDKTPTADSVTTRSVSVGVGLDAGAEAGDADGLRDTQDRAALEQVDHLLHEFLAAGGGSGSASGLIVTQSTQVIVDGQMVSADDPRALEALSTAAAKLREQGLDELAADLESRVAAAPAAGPFPLVAAQPAGGGAHALPPAAGMAEPAGTSQAVETAPAAAPAVPGEPWPAGSEAGAAPIAPAPPEPPSPPS